MPDKIKILFLAPHLSTGGMPSFLLKRIESLINYPDIEIFVCEYSNFSDQYVVQKNKIKSLVKPENFFTLGADKSQIIDIIKDNSIDIIHCDEMLEGFEHFNRVPESLQNEIYSNDRTWRIVETCHNVWFNPNISKKFNPDAYAFCTPWHKEHTFSQMPSYSEVIEFPIEFKKITPEDKVNAKTALGLDQDKIHVVNVGLWTSGKNQKEGVEIARIVEKLNPDIQFHFVGNQASNFKDYWAPVMDFIPSNVKVWGERHDVSEFLKAADIFMFNSTWECNPLVIKEAISYGLKILSRNLPQYMNMFLPYIEVLNDDLHQSTSLLLNTINKARKYEDLQDQFQEFSEKYYQFYKKVMSLEKTEQKEFFRKPEFIQHFVGSPYLEIKGQAGSEFEIKFEDEMGKIHYSEKLPINHWVRLNRQYYTKWKTTVSEGGNIVYQYTLDLENKRVYVSIESRSLGDNLAWMPYADAFQKKHNCQLIISTFWNNLFRENYPNLQFVEPGQTVDNLYAQYRVGWFYKDEKPDTSRNPSNFRTQAMQKTASDILGLEFTELKPKLTIPKVEKKKKVGIAIHSTAQSKYWNNPFGWQEVTDYLISLGYEVVLYSKESNGYMGNYEPKGITKFESGDIEPLIEDLCTCEFFIGLGSGLSWLSWSLNLPTIIISGFSESYTEPKQGIFRVINDTVCHGCFNMIRLDASDWKWCPSHKETANEFECTKTITSDMVIEKIKTIINGKA